MSPHRIPPIRATEAAECGLASLAMVANALGYRCTLAELRQRFSLSLKGATLAQIIDMAGQLGLQSRPLRLELDELDQLARPCILHWDLNHFVVLSKVDRHGIVVLDPARGERRLSIAEASKHFTGVALELSPGPDFAPKPEPPTVSWRQLSGRMDGLVRALALVLGLSIALQVFVLLAPFFMQWTVDQVLVSADHDLLTVLGLGFGLSLLLQVAIGALRGWTVTALSAQIGLQWGGNVFSHLLRLPMAFFEKRHLGDVVSRMSSVATLQKTMTTSFVEAIVDGLMATATLVLMLVYSWKLALVTLLAVVLYLGLRLATYRAFRDRSESQLENGARQQTHLLESLRGMQSLKLAGIEAQRRATYGGLMVETSNSEIGIARLGIGFSSAQSLVFGLERIAVIWIGATLAMENVFSVGMLIAYLAYKDQFAGRVGALIDKIIEFRMLRLHGERLADIVLTAPESDRGERTLANLPKACLKVSGLGFRYGDGERWVLKDLDFEIPEGESVAIVGASGCGKSTLAKLLLGLMSPQEGRIEVDGIDLAKLGMRNYRRMTAAVMQDDQLFAGSLIDNIALGDEAFDLERVEEAARMAGIHDEIAAMPMGYHTLVGDMGAALSGGQRQRVILARALYRKPALLVLDEATSHLDVDRERWVNDAVRKLNLTRIIIAHRPETIASADRVLVMHGGRIVQQLTTHRGATSPQAVSV